MRTTIKVTTVLALVLTFGLHWALLQTVAWTGMIISYSQANSFSNALRMTFDGQHPCCLCKAIKQGRAEEKQQENLAPRNKLPLAIIWEAPIFCFEVARTRISISDEFAQARKDSPPKPRPRSHSPLPLV